MRVIAIAAALFASACSTITPLQTASVVDRGWFRVGGQLSAAGFCGNYRGGPLGVLQCVDFPDGVPLPEARADGRYGLAPGFDVGGSVQLQGFLFAPEKSAQLGATADLKGELLRVASGGVTHVVSAGLLAGWAVAGRFSLPAWTQSEWGVPVFYGVQFRHVELVLSSTISRRSTHSPSLSPSTEVTHLGFSLGLFKRDPSGIAVQVGYLTDPTRFDRGAIQLQVGLFFDVR